MISIILFSYFCPVMCTFYIRVTVPNIARQKLNRCQLINNLYFSMQFVSK